MYQLAPYEAITEKQYTEMAKRCRKLISQKLLHMNLLMRLKLRKNLRVSVVCVKFNNS